MSLNTKVETMVLKHVLRLNKFLNFILSVFILFFLLTSLVFASKYHVKLGNRIVTIIEEKHKAGPTYIHLHQNETTALKAARAVALAHGGRVITLVHQGGERNVVFFLHKVRYEFDPNRIYTDAGIKKTLTEFGNYSKSAHAVVKRLSRKIKSLLPKGKVIAVHNNASYSLKDYLPGHKLAHDAKSLHVNHKNYFRNFFLVTKKSNHVRLKKLNCNSVWQAAHATNDGSLSVFLSHRDYINVEAGYDQIHAQIKMLRLV